MIKGLDVSNLNGAVNMDLIKNAGNSFVIAKATEGSTFVDKYYNDNIRKAKALGLVTGAYVFARFTTKEKAIQEANFFKQIAVAANPDFVVLDFEQQCSGDMTDACLEFLKIASTVAPVLIYCNPSYIKAHLNSKITKYPLWVAHYGVSSPSTVLWNEYAIWQYSEKGQISGIGGYLDLNYMSDSFFNSLGGTRQPNPLVEQIKALQYDLNSEYNAGLVVDGVAGQATVAALKGIQNIIVKGHKSYVVLWVQQKLEGYGYLNKGSYTEKVYDEPTFQAVTNMQKNWGKATDGILGPQAWSIFLNN
ncbi:GH25 family lysozyme [Clostridium sp. Mt-5]|uniref:GH25 family lysozyme n=1 Tax=Clostridium moutaii TaxID=3240932 RepID=A0ABV4BSL0_9CLOT